MNVADILNEAAPLYGERTAIVFNDREVGFSSFHRDVRRCAAMLLANGLKPQDRVLLLAANRPEWLVCYFAVLSLGAVLVPVNPALKSNEVNFIVEDAAPTIAFVDAELERFVAGGKIPKMIQLPDNDGQGDWGQLLSMHEPLRLSFAAEESTPAIIFYTSGTTGRPKGAVLSHGATLSTLKRTGTWLGSSNDDCALIVGSFAFILHSTIAAAGHLAVGAKLVIDQRFHPRDALDIIKRYRVSVIMWVPTMYVMAIEYAADHPVDLSSLRICISGGAHLPWAVAERFEAAFGKAVLNGWGMTEGTPMTGFDPLVEERGRPESIGRPLPGCDVRVVDAGGNDLPPREIGELLLRGPSNMLHYYNRPDATAETIRDGWVWSGDLGFADDDGYLYVVGRTKDMIIRGGAKIYPAEVEEVLSTIPEVAESAVVGAPDDRYGESIVAYVRLSVGQRLSEEEILVWCRDAMATYKVPQRVVFLPDFPRGPTGKILKRELREQLAQ